MPLDREQARAVLTEALPADPKWVPWVDGILDRLEPCVTPRLAEVDARLIGEAEARLARIRAACERWDTGAYANPNTRTVANDIRQILDAS